MGVCIPPFRPDLAPPTASEPQMKKYIRPLLGLCISSILRELQGGLRDLAVASATASIAAERLPNRRVRATIRKLQSIPSVSLDEILGLRKAEVLVTVQRYEDGMLPPEQALAILALLVVERPAIVLEIGTFMGHTTKAMAMNLPDSIIHTVDLPPTFSPSADPSSHIPKDDFHLIARRSVGREFQDTEYEKRIHQHFGDTATWDFQQALGAEFFFIDGSHTYEYCKNDSEKCFDLCGGKGVFLWHDCDETHPGVIQMICEWRAMGRDIVRINGTPVAYWKAK